MASANQLIQSLAATLPGFQKAVQDDLAFIKGQNDTIQQQNAKIQELLATSTGPLTADQLTVPTERGGCDHQRDVAD